MVVSPTGVKEDSFRKTIPGAPRDNVPYLKNLERDGGLSPLEEGKGKVF